MLDLEHTLRVAYENALAEDQNSDLALKLEKIVLGGSRDERDLPDVYRSLLDRARCTEMIRFARDTHVCPYDEAQKYDREDERLTCTCKYYDQAIDALLADATDDEWGDLLKLFGGDLPSGNYVPTEEDLDNYPESDWRYLVGNGDTRLGYDEWVVSMLIMNLSDEELATRWHIN